MFHFNLNRTQHQSWTQSGPSTRKRHHEHRREGEDRGRQRRGYDGSMIEQWREVNGSIDGGGEKQIEKSKDRGKSSADGRGRSRREREREKIDRRRRASSGSPSRLHAARSYLNTQSQTQSREPSRMKKAKVRTSSDGKQAKPRPNSTDAYGRKKYQDRVYEYVDRPEDADGGECCVRLHIFPLALVPINFNTESILFASSTHRC